MQSKMMVVEITIISINQNKSIELQMKGRIQRKRVQEIHIKFLESLLQFKNHHSRPLYLHDFQDPEHLIPKLTEK